MKTQIISLKDFNKNNESIVLAYGHFTTIHAGHIRYLNYAKKLGKKLIIFLLPDVNKGSKKKYAFSQIERAEALSFLSIADFILLMDSEAFVDAVDLIKPEVIVFGKEYENTDDKNIVNVINKQRSNKLRVEFHAGEIHYASTDLLISSESELTKQRKKLLLEKCSKENIFLESILKSINKWDNTHLLVIGDTIVDQYAACEPIGLSAEAPVVVVKELQKKDFIGGAAIVASHIKALGAKCTFLSVTGDDYLSDFVYKKLNSSGINTVLIKDKSRPTTFKKRYVVENQKLFRVSKLEDHNLHKEKEDLLILKLRELAKNVKGIVVSDFVYGVITDNVLKEINLLAKKYSLMIFGDLQCSSQVGDISIFKNFTLLCPNEKETRTALKDNVSGLEKLSQKLIKLTNTEKLIMKLGADGFISYESKNNKIRNYSLPALSVNPVDVAGAGDSLLAVMSIGLSSKQTMFCSSVIASCMASLAVDTMGNLPITKKQLISKIINVFES